MSVSFQVFRSSKDGPIVSDTTRRELGQNDVYVRLTHSGVCGTDEHFLHSGIVLGHEGAGVVEKIGSHVQRFQIGDRVGFGYIHKVCGLCENCLSEKEQFCEARQMYGTTDEDEGSFGSHIVWDADMLFKFPEGLESKYAAPLMCGGATVWTALTMHGIKPADRVGIQGIGGLGHLAIQFAAKLGCEVVVLSSSESKRSEALQLGATEFHVMRRGSRIVGVKKLNHLLLCGSADADFQTLVPLMAAGGTIYPLTVSHQPSPIMLHDLVLSGVRIQGSLVAPRTAVRRMLDFAVLHDIKPIIMEWQLNKEGIEKAMQTLRDGKMRYRAVLVAADDLQ